MVEPQFVVLDVAGSSPVGHPNFFLPPSMIQLPNCDALASLVACGNAIR